MKVLIIYTGGTVGMKKSENGYVPSQGYLQQMLADIPDLKNHALPQYDIIEFSPLLDSSDIGPAEWNKIAETIKVHYSAYHSFIVLHGTDTMAYTASGLSFMMEGLNKSIIFTGSQIPLCEIRNDARDNIVTSLLLCAEYNITEVCIYFNGVLLRGNRAYKSKVSGFNAFYSPNFPPIGHIGSKFNIHTGTGNANFKIKHNEEIYNRTQKTSFQNISIPEESVLMLKIYPGISEKIFNYISQLNLKGLVIEAYGAGNVPSRKNNEYIKKTISDLITYGCIVVVCTQCTKGSVYPGDYATSLKAAGAISAADMTSEACLAKLYYVLSLDVPLEKQKELFETNLRGEMNILDFEND